MTTLRFCLLALICAPVLLLARPAAEDARIEYLLTSIKNLEGASFVRSGKSYDGKAAEDHLRMKLKKAGERVQTAEDFVTGIASKSYLTGKPYQIRFSDGRTVNAGDYLNDLLRSYKPPR